MQSAEPMSQTLEELQEKTDMVEYPQTLKYIRGALTKSKLRNFIQQLPLIGFARPAPSTSDKWAPTEHDGSFYDTFKKLLEQSNQASDADAPAELPKMNDLTKRLGLQFEKVFGQIALTQRRGILHRSPLALHPDCDKDIVDLVMRYEDVGEQRLCVIYVATRSIRSKHILYIYRTVLDCENGVSSTRTTGIGAIDLQEGEIRQIQFVEDDTIMVLWSNNEGFSYLLNFPFQPAPTSESPPFVSFVDYDSYITSSTPAAPTVTLDVLAQESESTQWIKHAFTIPGPKLKPTRIYVNGRHDRRAICVLYGDGLRYEVLDLDAEMEDEEEEDEEPEDDPE
ncbi:anaphase-promoting complex component Cut20/Apc4 [Aspergillus arachidicola]|uniref:Anaphase-promoting complex component Cut20/Apc4 n=1 Tax=Aspergillus arachidicola TaxID=656916 RepID=A0A2G7GAN5_9EURO|nr:anaphase-promoting complex component Cut20/Apc4 [Aspergillus arachidicola]